ncbi:hypothetical protein PMAYCL1PPCAC_05181, partial [Pristionchus mayeri]
MTRGVMRTTLAAFLISIGSWLFVCFFTYFFSVLLRTGRSPFTKLQFSLIFRLLNVINNVLTAWVLIATFSKVRRSVLGYSVLSTGSGPGSVRESQ